MKLIRTKINIRNYIDKELLLFTKITNFDSINKESFLFMEKDLTNPEVLTEKTFWELLTEENVDKDEFLYGEGEIRQEDY